MDQKGFDKLFYGPTFGAGVDWRVGALRKNYLSIALTVPIRSAEVENYRNDLKNNHGIEFKKQFYTCRFFSRV